MADFIYQGKRVYYTEAGEGELPIAPGVAAGFAADMGPFFRDFPKPFFQCWLSMTLPWVIEEPPD